MPYYFAVKSSPCDSYPCLNGGICSENGDKYSCTCTTGHTGVRCEKKVGKFPTSY